MQSFINILSANLKNIAGASGGGEDKRLKKNIEYILIYAKSYFSFKRFSNSYKYIDILDIIDSYKLENKSWKYTSVLLHPGSSELIATTNDGDGDEIKIFRRSNFVIKSINKICEENNISLEEAYVTYAEKIFQTAMPQSSIRPRIMRKIEELGIKGELFSIQYVPKTGRNKNTVYEQFYKGDNLRLFAWLKDVSEIIDNKLYKKEMLGTYWDVVGSTKNLSKEGDVQFSNGKKPVALIKRMLELQEGKEFIALDFFSGSATTAHAVMQLNAEDGGNRKFIMVQLPEACDPKSEAYKAGYKTIADIGRERIRRAGAKILAGECHEGWSKDVGFRSLLVDSSNMNDAYYSPAETKQGQLDLWAREYIKSGRSGEDLLFQVLLDWGLGLTLPIERQQICGLEVFIVDDDQLVACFAQAGEIDDELFYHLAKLRPRRALFRSSGLTVDSTQTNAEQIFGLISPSTEIKIL